MKKLLLILLLSLPMLVTAQSTLPTPAQSKAKLQQLKQLNKDYNISWYIGPCNIAVFLKDEMYGLVTFDGKVIVPAESYDVSYQSEAKLFALNKGDSICLVDCKGRRVLPYEFTFEDAFMGVEMFVNGMTVAVKDGKYGIVDTAERIVVPFVYDNRLGICRYGKGLMYSYSDDYDSTYLLSFNGDTVIGLAQDISVLPGGRVEVRRDSLYGYYDLNGHVLLPCRYKESLDFVDGKAIAQTGGGMFGIIDTTGREIVHLAEDCYKGDYPALLSPQLIVNYRNGKCGVLDIRGNVVVPHKYSHLYSFTSGRIVMSDDEFNIVVLDTGGRQMERYSVDPFVDEWGFVAGGFIVQKDGLWGFVDDNWDVVIPPHYKELEQLDVDFFSVLLDDGQRAIVDRSSKTIVKGPYKHFQRISGGIYGAESYYNTDSDSEKTPYLYGFVDIYGNTSFTPAEMKRMKKWMKNRDEN